MPIKRIWKGNFCVYCTSKTFNFFQILTLTFFGATPGNLYCFIYEIFLTTHYTYYSFFSCSPTGCSSWIGSGQIISSCWGVPGGNRGRGLHRKKRLATFPSPAGTSLNKLSLGGNTVIKLFPPRETLVSYIAAGDGNVAYLFVTVYLTAARRANHWVAPRPDLTVLYVKC